MNEYRIKELIREDREEHSGGCSPFIILVLLFVVLGPPLGSIAVEFWRTFGCDKGWTADGCDKQSVKFWREWHIR